MRTLVLVSTLMTLFASAAVAETTVDPNFPLVRLPSDFRSQRVTRRVNPEGGQSFMLLDAKGPGCVRHFWITLSKGDRASGRTMRLKIVVDGAKKPQVDMRLDHFFAVMLDRDVYPIESAAIKLLPVNGFNCYLPIPFSKSCRITLTNEGDKKIAAWSMVNWHQYKNAEGLTPYRFHAVFNEENPAEKAGSFPMATVSGRGFVAGLVKAIRVIDRSDSWYHTGGDLWLIDGETDPHALRGIGGEDVFGYSFGVHQSCSQWTGTPHVQSRTDELPTEMVAYRFFGPDPVAFDTSLVVRFGSKANETQSVVYYYQDPATTAPKVESPRQWTLLGPFQCETPEDFDRAEFPEKDPSHWPKSWTADFGQYRVRKGPATFGPTKTESEHTWVDFTRHLRAPKRTNVGTQPTETAAYATTVITADKEETVDLVVGFDDWLKLWINGRPVAKREHNEGFATATIPVKLRAGENRLLLKLSNFNNQQWRLWAFSCRIDRK